MAPSGRSRPDTWPRLTSMSSRIDFVAWLGAVLAHGSVRRAIAATVLIVVPTTVWCGLDVRRAPAAQSEARPAPAAPATSAPLLRCWQHGRLLFEERDIE